MKIVIDIPDEDYNVILENADFYKEKHWGLPAVWDAIVNGTPLSKEPGRKFEEIVVEYPDGYYGSKPYFSIKYEENGEHIIGFGTYDPELLSSDFKEYFIDPNNHRRR